MNGNENLSYENDEIIPMPERKSSSQVNQISFNPAEPAQDDNVDDKKINYSHGIFKEHKRYFTTSAYILVHFCVISYFAYATYYFIHSENARTEKNEKCYGKCGIQWCNGYGMLLILIVFMYFGLFYYKLFKPKIGNKIEQQLLKPTKHLRKLFLKSKVMVSTILVIILLIIFGIFLYVETKDTPEKLISLTCPILFILTGYTFSTDRNAIKWRPVIMGIICQFLLGVICIRWEIGRNIFHCAGDKVASLLSYTNEGSRFVFGQEMIKKQIFAFAILPVIFFFSFLISILYYLGVMQRVIMKLGWILQKLLDTTVCESVSSAGNIFLGMSESPLLIRPYIKFLTKSELHAIMVSGFATVSGTVLAAYISFGAKPAHLITSCVMAAPAALGFSKLYFPETEVSQTKSNNIKLEKSKDCSILDAASNGAAVAIEIILGIIANLVAFIAFIAFVNGIFNWFGYLIGQDELTFEWIFSKLFIPLSWTLGIPWKECDIAAKVIASKTIINEFVAYERLGYYTRSGALSARSSGILTFAICGFANPGSLGIFMGILGAMAPNKKPQITSVSLRAFAVGSIVCFVSASFTGLLMIDESLPSIDNKLDSIFNSTF